MSGSPTVRMYTTPWCGYCGAARALLKNKGVRVEEIDVSTDTKLRAEMTRLSGGHTVPQIFVDAQPVGGYDDLSSLDSEGRLDELLGLK